MKKSRFHGKQSLSEAMAARDERIMKILTTGIEAGRITSKESEEFHLLAKQFEEHNNPKTYMAMQAILRKAQG